MPTSIREKIRRLEHQRAGSRARGDTAGERRAARQIERLEQDRRDILGDFEERIPGQTRATPPKKPTTSGQESSATATPQPAAPSRDDPAPKKEPATTARPQAAATSKDDPKDVTSHPQPAGDSPRDNRKLAEAEQAASTTAVPQPGSSRSNLSARTAELERLEKAGTLTADEKRELAGNRGQTDRQTAGAVLAGAGVAIAPAVLTGAVAKQVLAVIARGGQSGQAAPATLIKVSQGQIIIMASVGGTISALNVKGNKERLDAIGDWIKGKIARGESFQGQLEGLKDSTPTQAGNKLFEQATSMGGIDKPDTKALDQLKTISKPVDGVSERVGTTTKERPDTAEPLEVIDAVNQGNVDKVLKGAADTKGRISTDEAQRKTAADKRDDDQSKRVKEASKERSASQAKATEQEAVRVKELQRQAAAARKEIAGIGASSRSKAALEDAKNRAFKLQQLKQAAKKPPNITPALSAAAATTVVVAIAKATGAKHTDGQMAAILQDFDERIISITPSKTGEGVVIELDAGCAEHAKGRDFPARSYRARV